MKSWPTPGFHIAEKSLILFFLHFRDGLASITLVPTLLLTPRSTDDAQELWRGCARLNWNVHRVHGWKVPALDPADVAVYAEPLLATHIAQALKLELLEPEVDWLPSLPERWRNRTILLSTMKEARGILEPRFIKSAAGKEFDARVYASGKDLPRGEMISDSLAVLIQEIVHFDVEYRCFVSDRVVKTASSYWRHGKDPRDERGLWSVTELSEATQFCAAFLADSAVGLPDACVVDVGFIQGKGWSVIECNAAWSSGVYGCDGAEILPVLRRACRPKL